MNSRTKLRILHIVPPTYGCTYSGHSRFVQALLRRWSDPTIEMKVHGSARFSFSDGFGKDNHSGDQTFRLSRSQRISWTFNLIKMLIKDRNQYDILHLHTLYWGGLLSPIIAHFLGKSAIYMITLLDSDNPGAVEKQKFGKLKVSLYKQFDGVIGLAPNLIQDCLDHKFNSRLLLLPNYMIIEDLECGPSLERRHAAREKLRIPASAKVILLVGSMIERKGVDKAIDVFIKFSQEQNDLWLILVGPNSKNYDTTADDNYVARQQEKVASSGLKDRVFWTGFIENPHELANYYHASDLFLLPTKAEGSPNVFAEAMACGLPVVTTCIPGITDFAIKDGENGILVIPGSQDGYYEAAKLILNNPDMQTKMGKQGRKRALQMFGFDEYCKKLGEFYKDITETTDTREQGT